MSTPRFTVEFCRVNQGHGWREGWRVCDRGRPITILFETCDEAERRRDNIHRIYLRFGW